MARRTKADAQATRASLLDAAEQLFQARGVSRTSLQDIAAAAGTTRGAIYWHFKDKADLFNAMMDRVTLPLEEPLLQSPLAEAADPLGVMCRVLVEALRLTAQDERTRRVFDIATQKVEYVDELSAVRERRLSVRCQAIGRIEQALTLAAGPRGLPVPPKTAALGLMVMFDGLLQNWLLAPEAFDLVNSGRKTIDIYLAGLGLSQLPTTQSS